MKTIASLLLVLSLLICSGCSRVTKTYLAEDVFVQPTNSGKDYFTDDEKIDLSKVNAADYDGSSNTAKRDILISDMIALSDKKCTWHKATVMANANVWNIAAGTASILFAGAASVVDSAQTASELAAAAAATSGVRALVNQEIYADALVTTILRAIDVHRTKRYAVISAGLGDNTYTVARAVRDVQAYHDACSLMAGLVEVTSALDNRKKARSEVTRDIASLEKAIKGADQLFGTADSTDKQAYLKPLQEKLSEKHIELTNAAE